MTEVLNVHPPNWILPRRSPLSSRRYSFPSLLSSQNAISGNPSTKWKTLREELKCQGRYSCFFADSSKQEQARKALESALDGKKTVFEKWNKEIQKREEMGGGGTAGRGGWFGGGGWFGWFGGEHFWGEAQQASLALIGIISLYLLIGKGNILFAVVSNSLLFLLRGFRNWFTFLSASTLGRTSLPTSGNDQMAKDAYQPPLSAKERVVRKWGMD
ncbi:hypothetical protein M5K25_006926 [Dendrobium thyrsiflorum]|uniref:Uncharacterized protein n=1 Tax=Dendrobium thyrsiflorum TaxID=117978 RepID=A0ABD0VJV1_DENTH